MKWNGNLMSAVACAAGVEARALAVIVALTLSLNQSVLAAEGEGAALMQAPAADDGYDAQYLLRQAEQGDTRAAFLLGSRFATGSGGTRDDSEAFRWFERAAEAGLAEAQYNLGVLYASGRGTVKSMTAAARWYEQAANQGIAEAQFNIGTLYALGIGVEKDEVRAAEWLQRAAVKELPEAQFNLGVLHEHGRGVRLDGRAAMAWYRRAAEKGYPPAKDRLKAMEAKFTQREVAPALTSVPAPPPESDQQKSAELTWLLKLDPEGYTLQLLSDTDEGNVRRFVDAYVDPAKGGYFSSRIKGAVWYSVVYGNFPNYDSAKAAIDDLPAAMGKLKPWIRKIGSVHKQMGE